MMAQLEEEASEKEKLVDQKVEMERKLQLMVEPDRAKGALCFSSSQHLCSSFKRLCWALQVICITLAENYP